MPTWLCPYLKVEKEDKDSAYLSQPQRETTMRHNSKIKLITSVGLFPKYLKSSDCLFRLFMKLNSQFFETLWGSAAL